MNTDSARHHFLFLDIDGVLLEPEGYLSGYLDSFNDYLIQMGQPELRIDRRMSEAFQAIGIHAEWDMLPLSLAAFMDLYLSFSGTSIPEAAFPPCCDLKVFPDNDRFLQALLGKIAQIGKLLRPGQLPMDCIRRAVFESGADPAVNPFLRLRGSFFESYFLVDTLDPRKRPFFAALMNRLLCSETFSTFYQIPAPFVCTSYLETLDTQLIKDRYSQMIQDWTGRAFDAGVLTARPTRLPAAEAERGSAYFVNTPEGECAMKLLSWQNSGIRMIGTGSLCLIEEQYGLRREHYLKPHPVHALAVMTYCLCGDEVRALELARHLYEDDSALEENPIASYLNPEQGLCLTVADDSRTGILSVKNAAEVLRHWGYDVTTNLCGIRTTPAKAAQLVDAGASIYADVNQVLGELLPCLISCNRRESQ